MQKPCTVGLQQPRKFEELREPLPRHAVLLREGSTIKLITVYERTPLHSQPEKIRGNKNFGGDRIEIGVVHTPVIRITPGWVIDLDLLPQCMLGR